MAFYHKKFLLPEKTDPDKKPEDDNNKEYESGCKTCDDCPDLCAKYYPPSPSSKHHMSTAMILSLCIIGAAFLFLSCFVILRYRSRRRNSRRLDDDIFRQDIIDELQGPVIDHPIWYIRTVGLPQSVIDSIEVFKFKTGEGLVETSDCSVCLSEFQEDESLRLLPKCSHAFHVECIDMWLRSHKNCPVCRAPVINSNNGDEIDSGETSSSDSGLMEENNQVESDVGGEETGEMMSGDENTSVSTVEDEKIDEVLLKGNGGNGRFRVLSDLADHRVKVDQELEAVRRSVSLDFSSASTIYVAVANVAKKDEGCCDSALFQGPVSVKKSCSFSCLKKHSRS